MYPEIFHVSFLHTYGVLVALAFLAALWMAAARQAAGLNPETVTNLGIYCALAAIAGRQADDVHRGLPLLRGESRRDFLDGDAAGGRRVLRRADRGARRGVVVHAEDEAAAAADGGCLRSRDRPGPRYRAAGMFFGGLLLGRRVPPALGGDVHESGGAELVACRWIGRCIRRSSTRRSRSS